MTTTLFAQTVNDFYKEIEKSARKGDRTRNHKLAARYAELLEDQPEYVDICFRSRDWDCVLGHDNYYHFACH